MCLRFIFFFKQKTAYEMRISDWSSDVCSSDLFAAALPTAKIYVYDNNSIDGSREIAAGAGAIVRSVRQQGKGHVVRRMFADVDADIYIMADADATYQASAAPAMVADMLAGNLDMVVGDRKSTRLNSRY